MKKNLYKKLITMTMVGGMILSSAVVFAEKPMLISANTTQIPQGTIVLDKDMYKVDGSTIYMPLRNVTEGLDMKISWNEETRTATVKYIDKELSVSIDGEYSKGDKEYEKPLIIEDRLYIPLEALGESLGVKFDKQGDRITCIKQNIEKELTGYGEILEINDGKDAKLVTFMNTYNMQKYTLIIGKDTKVTDTIANKGLDSKDLKVGDFIYSEYSEMMTRSIPPQTVAKKVEIVNDIAVSYGVVEQVKDGKLVINIGTRGGVYINLSEDGVIENESGDKLNFSDIKLGDKIRVYHAQVMLAVEPMTYPTVKIVKVK